MGSIRVCFKVVCGLDVHQAEVVACLSIQDSRGRLRRVTRRFRTVYSELVQFQPLVWKQIPPFDLRGLLKVDMEPPDFEPMAPHLREPDLDGIGYLSLVSKPRDPVERELLRQQGDPVAQREDPGWIRLAGARAIRQPLPLNVEATQAWLQEEQTLEAVDTWVRQRTVLRQRVTPELPSWREQVRWVLEYALLQGPGDPHRYIYISERAITRAVEYHDRQEMAEALRLKNEGRNEFIVGPIHWSWILAWVGRNLPFPSHPENVSAEEEATNEGDTP